jgi:hypothetical protein
MKIITLAFTLLVSTSAFSWVENELDFNSHPHYSEIVDSLYLDCGPNEAGYEMVSIDVSYETENDTCYNVSLIQTWDDDYGPVHDEFESEVCIKN